MSKFALIFLGLISTQAFGHAMKLFVQVEGYEISGYVYFSPEVRARAVLVELTDENGLVDKQTTNEQGEFRFTVDAGRLYGLIADDGMGHEAVWQMGTPIAVVLEPEIGQSNDCQQMASQLAQQINQLRQELAHYRDHRHWQDMMGGLGYIAGIFGLFALFRRH